MPNDPDLQIPVAFVPPKIPVAEAGLLVDGEIDTKETAATLVDLAVRGGAHASSARTRTTSASTCSTRTWPRRPHEMALLNGIFRGDPPGHRRRPRRRRAACCRRTRTWTPPCASRSPRAAGSPRCPAEADHGAGLRRRRAGALRDRPRRALGAAARGRAAAGGRSPSRSSSTRCAAASGRPEGRAWTDQVEGFQKYLATAEADQLRFEEGEDIFSRYLPWAIVFGLADRWAKVCGDLVAMGRIPDTTPYWYYGNINLASFNTGLPDRHA